jgi:hypothetical protein
MTIDFSKPVTTRDGRPVRILCTDRPGEWPVVGLIEGNIHAWTADGRNQPHSPSYDLINPKTKREAWAAIFQGSTASGGLVRLFTSQQAADEYVKNGKYLAVARVEWEE